MSIARLATRLVAVHALRGATLAEDRVYDSSITPIEMAVSEHALPFLMVTTDAHIRDTTGRDLSSGDDALDLVIETAIATRVTITTPDGETETQITIPNTDAGLEFTLDLIEAQVARALTDQHDVWSRLFCLLVPVISRRVSRRGASAEDGLRFAARQITLTCDTLADPIPGTAITEASVWGQFLAAVAADADLGPLEPVLRQQIEGAAVSDWGQVARLMGLSDETVAALGLAPEVLATNGAAVTMTAIDAMDEADGSVMEITEAAADGQGA